MLKYKATIIAILRDQNAALFSRIAQDIHIGCTQ
jgi:hypothetical protein